MPNSSLLEIQKLNVKFSSPLGTVHALKNVSFSVEKGSILGVVGESGCGKSTISNSILGLLAKNAKIESGEIKFEGKNLLAEPDVAMQKLRGPEIATIFQDPVRILHKLFREKCFRNGNVVVCIEENDVGLVARKILDDLSRIADDHIVVGYVF